MMACPLARLLARLIDTWRLRYATANIAAGWRQVAREWEHAALRWQAEVDVARADRDAALAELDEWVQRFEIVYHHIDDTGEVDAWLHTYDWIVARDEVGTDG